jgi:hypothetical protein
MPGAGCVAFSLSFNAVPRYRSMNPILFSAPPLYERIEYRLPVVLVYSKVQIKHLVQLRDSGLMHGNVMR